MPHHLSPDVAGSPPVPRLAPGAPRVEHHRAPLGIGEPCPRLSWYLPDTPAGARQVAYEIEATTNDVPTGSGTTDDVLTSGRVTDDESLWRPWPFAPLTSRSHRRVRVRVWTDASPQPSPWSDPTDLETGLLHPGDWAASVVRASVGHGGVDLAEQPGVLLRRRFEVDRPVARARLYVTAEGIYEAWLNGARVGDDTLSPGWTSYPSRLQYATHDVTALVRLGGNVIGVHVADGWHRGHLGFQGGRAFYGERTGVLAQLELTHADGTTSTLVSDDGWRWRTGPVVAADLYHGETFDARLEDATWCDPAAERTDSRGTDVWAPVDVAAFDTGRLVAPCGPPVRATELITPVAITRSPSGAVLVDLGVNLVGRLRLHVPQASAGSRVVVRHAEVLEHGELGVRPLRTARACDTFVHDGRGPRVWEPSFTVHGFRYAQVDGWPGELTPEQVTAVVLHSDVAPAGTFECSDPDVTQLHENVVRSLRGNLVGLPTDCPQRDERLGWTGDLAVFAPTAAYLYDVTGLLTSWLRDLRAEQRPDGVVPLFVPWIDTMPPGFDPFPVEAGWGDAVILVPWALYERTGDLQVLAENADAMRAWLAAFTDRAGPDLDFPQGGRMLGDWLDAAAPDEEPWRARVPWQLVATAHLARSAQLMGRISTLLDVDPAPYERLADAAAQRFRDAYVSPEGHVTPDAQTAHALAITFDLLPPEQRHRTGDDLAARVAADGHHIGTGFLGTPHVCDALVTTGHADVAHRLLTRRTCPSWLYPVTMGATTIWERWNSMLPDGTINPGHMTSFNHYALGAIADWLHRSVAGLAPAAPGYRRIQVAPHPGDLTHARAHHETPYGPALVHWTRTGTAGTFRLTVTAPPGTTALVTLPDGSPTQEVPSGTHTFTCRTR